MQAYLDNSATTKCAPEVVDVCVKVMSEDYGNPSSKHMKGVEAENYIKEAKETIAKTLKCQEKEILFTSGGSNSYHRVINSAFCDFIPVNLSLPFGYINAIGICHIIIRKCCYIKLYPILT